MHPIEHLRYMARARGADPALLAREGATVLAEISREQPAGLLPACRRLVEHHVAAGPVWWVSARMLRSDDPARTGRDCVDELEEDGTAGHLEGLLPDSATALVVGWPDLTAPALRRRGDVEVLVVEWDSDGSHLVSRLRESGNEATIVPESGAAAAAAVVDLVVLEALAAGPTGVLAVPGSLAAALSAANRQVPVWAVAGIGRVLPEPLWDALLSRLDGSGEEPWDRPAEVVPADLITQLVGPEGAAETVGGLLATTCPPAPELLRPAG